METNLNRFLAELATEINNLDSRISLIHFGSSVGRNFQNNMDIDILLLSTQDYCPIGFRNKLNNMKASILSGKNVTGFRIEAPVIHQKINKFILAKSSRAINFVPKYIFGPYSPCIVQGSDMNVFLHFKGPVTEEQFSMFCSEFPFHGMSIIYNSKVFQGEFNRQSFDCREMLTVSEFNCFLNSLKTRAIASSTGFTILKCIRKLVQNYLIMNGVYKIAQNDIIRIAQQEFLVDINPERQPDELKEQFLKIFHSIQTKFNYV
jgi:hypothetical protein